MAFHVEGEAAPVQRNPVVLGDVAASPEGDDAAPALVAFQAVGSLRAGNDVELEDEPVQERQWSLGQEQWKPAAKALVEELEAGLGALHQEAAQAVGRFQGMEYPLE